MFSVGLIEIIAGIQIVLAADLKPNLFIPGSAFPNKSAVRTSKEGESPCIYSIPMQSQAKTRKDQQSSVRTLELLKLVH